jgi:redox-sensing transcriptional repressor
LKVPEPTLRRLPLYYQYLKKELALGNEFVSGTDIARGLDLTSIQVRKDLQATGAVGKPKIGYHIESTIKCIEKNIGYNNNKDAFLVGAGNLGKALLGYEGFQGLGLNIIAAFDTDPEKIGSEFRGKSILDLEKFPELVKRLGIKIGIITVPATEAQSVCQLMIESGIKAIWNFAPVHLSVPEQIIIQNENLAASLSVLSKKLLNKENKEKEQKYS